MASGSREERKQGLREARQREEAEAAAAERRQRMAKLGAAAVFAAIVVVAAAILISQSGSDSSGGDESSIEGAAQVQRLLTGIPQQDLVLGKPGASARLIEFGDLQCPICAEYSETVIPELISGPVREGLTRLEFSNFLIIGPESADAGAAAIAAGEQGRGWNFVELFYRNQGIENSGYVTDSFLESIARAAGVANIDQWNTARKSPAVRREMTRTSRQASGLGLSGTPSFVAKGPGGTKVLGTPGTSLAPFDSAIDQVGQ